MVTEIELFKCPDLTSLEFRLYGWMKERILQKEGEYTRRITRSHLEYCCLHKET